MHLKSMLSASDDYVLHHLLENASFINKHVFGDFFKKLEKVVKVLIDIIVYYGFAFLCYMLFVIPAKVHEF